MYEQKPQREVARPGGSNPITAAHRQRACKLGAGEQQMPDGDAAAGGVMSSSSDDSSLEADDDDDLQFEVHVDGADEGRWA